MAWTNYFSSTSDQHIFILIDQGFSNRAPIQELPQLSWFSIYCQKPAGNSFWDPDETESLDHIENDLIRLCRAFGHGWAVYVLRIAMPGIREYYLYHSNQAELGKAFVSLKSIYSTYRIELNTIQDPSWRKYIKFAR